MQDQSKGFVVITYDWKTATGCTERVGVADSRVAAVRLMEGMLAEGASMVEESRAKVASFLDGSRDRLTVYDAELAVLAEFRPVTE